jgi:hypothetical protein
VQRRKGLIHRQAVGVFAWKSFGHTAGIAPLP